MKKKQQIKTKKLKYVSYFYKKGSIFWRFRKTGICRYFKSVYGTHEFMIEYDAFLNGIEPEIGISYTIRDSLSELIANYYKSPLFIGLGDETRKQYQRQIDNFRNDYGHMSVKTIQRKHIQAIINNMADKPNAANNLYKKIRILMKLAIKLDMRTDNPCNGVDMFKIKTDGHHTWTDIEIEAFQKQHPLGTQAYLSLTLLLYTGTRRSEVIKLGRQHMKDGKIAVQHLKGSDYTVIPIHPILATALETAPRGGMLFLIKSDGSGYSPGGFGNKMRNWCDEAGLSHCSAHGLKKSISVKLAEAGCSEKEIMSITGHKTMSEVVRYTRNARQKILAENSITKLATHSKKVAK